MSPYDPMAFMILVVAGVLAFCALCLEREKRPAWQYVSIFVGAIILCILAAILMHLGRKPYIVTAQQSAVFLPPHLIKRCL